MVATILRVDNNPRPCRIFRRVIAAFFQHFVVVGVQSRVATTCFGRVKFVYQPCNVIAHRHEIGFGCGCRETETAIVVDVCLSVFVALGGDKHHAETGTRTIDGGRSGIFKYRNTLDVVGVNAVDAAFYTIDEYQWCARVGE